jgi:hypothetical protein
MLWPRHRDSCLRRNTTIFTGCLLDVVSSHFANAVRCRCSVPCASTEGIADTELTRDCLQLSALEMGRSTLFDWFTSTGRTLGTVSYGPAMYATK